MLDFDWLISPMDEDLAAAAAAATTSTTSKSTALVPAATTAVHEPGFWSQVGAGFKGLYEGIGAWFADSSQTSPAGRLAEGVGQGAALAGAGVGQGAAAAGAGVGSGMGWGIPVALGLGAVVLGAVLLVKLPGAR